MSEEVKEPRKRGGNNGKSPVIGDNALKVAPGDLTAFIQSMVDLKRLPPIKTDEELEERLNLYFDWCIQNDMKPGVEGMALACGVDRRTLWDWETANSWKYSRRAEIVKRAKQIIACGIEQLIMQNKINVIGGIFMMKNHFGYTDKSEVELSSSNNALSPGLTREQIIEKIKTDVVVDIDEDEEL